MRKRVAALGMIAVLGATTATPVSASTSAGAPAAFGAARGDQAASYGWTERHKGYIKSYGVYLVRGARAYVAMGAPDAGAYVFAYVDRCVPRKRFYVCTPLREVERSLLPTEYELDPLMQSASVEFGSNRVTWQGRGDLETSHFSDAGYSHHGWRGRNRVLAHGYAHAVAHRRASVEGELFGKTIRDKRGGGLYSGVSTFELAHVCVNSDRYKLC